MNAEPWPARSEGIREALDAYAQEMAALGEPLPNPVATSERSKQPELACFGKARR